MKKILSLMCAVLLIAGPISACKKKTPVAQIERTVIVMDSTQALLDGVQVKLGDMTFKTSFDGKVVIKPEQLGKANEMVLSRNGYETKKIALDDTAFMLVTLVRKTGKKTDSSVYDDKPMLRYSMTGASPRADKLLSSSPVMGEAEMMNTGAYDDIAGEMPKAGHAVAHPNVAAGMLTAGEVNDFAKWYFWHNVLDSTHKQFIQEWGIEPRHRYIVQLMNDKGAPMAARAVTLIDNRGNTVFQTMTDNTGKAELWGKEGVYEISVEDQRVMAKEWKEGMNVIIVDDPCNNSSDVDVMFVFDATGSMGDELKYLQAEMKDVISRAKDATGGLSIRTGAVVYRDHGDDYITRISRLTEDISATQQFIDKQQASGGGDYPEAVPEALMAAFNSAGWNEEARARIAFLILDAPCHKDSASLALLNEQILNAAALGIRIVPVVCSGLGESGEYLLRSMALLTNGTSFFLTDDSGIGHTHLKPTTDSLKVEHLNDMLVRTIVEFSSMPNCDKDQTTNDEIAEDFVPNPFEAADLEKNPEIPHGEGVHYLVDMSGKLITIVEGEVTNYEEKVKSYGLPAGVYFFKAYIDNKWFTKKVLVL